MSSKDKTDRDDDKPELDNEDPSRTDGPLRDVSAGDEADGLADSPQETDTQIEDAEIVAENAAETAEDGSSEREEEEAQADPDATDDANAETTDSAETADDSAETPPDPETTAGETLPPLVPVPAPAPQKSGGGFFPALLGGLVAAGIGFGASAYLGGDLFGDDSAEQALAQQIAQQSERLSTLESKLEARLSDLAEAVAAPAPDTGMGDQISALGDRLADQVSGVGTRIDGLSGTIETLQGDLSGVDDRLGTLDTRLADVNDRLSAVEKRPLTESSEAAKQAFAAYERDLEELRSALREQQSTNDTLAAEMDQRAAAAQAEVEAAAARAAELQKQAEEQARTAEEQAETRARAAATREALASLDAALKTGSPFKGALDVLGQSADLPEALTAAADSGVASLADLRGRFPALSRAALDASIRETVADGVGDRFSAFLRTQTGVRSLEPRDGSDPDAVLSRAEAAVDDGDLSTALAELAQLPPAGQDVMADWRSQAETRLAVTSAADTLAKTLLAN